MFEAPEKISRGLKHSHSHHSHLEEDVSTKKPSCSRACVWLKPSEELSDKTLSMEAIARSVTGARCGLQRRRNSPISGRDTVDQLLGIGRVVRDDHAERGHHLSASIHHGCSDRTRCGTSGR